MDLNYLEIILSNKFFIAILVLYVLITWYLIKFICWKMKYPVILFDIDNNIRNVKDFIRIIKNENILFKRIVLILIIITHYIGLIMIFIVAIFYRPHF